MRSAPANAVVRAAAVVVLVVGLSGCEGRTTRQPVAAVRPAATTAAVSPLVLTPVTPPRSRATHKAKPLVPVGTRDKGAALDRRYAHLKATASQRLTTRKRADISMPWLLLRRHGEAVDVLFVGGVGRCVLPVGHFTVVGPRTVEVVMVSRTVKRPTCGAGTNVLRARFTIAGSRGLILLHAPVSRFWAQHLPKPKVPPKPVPAAHPKPKSSPKPKPNPTA
ncbi:hypothetical protein acdb102_19630 [Acidothermaceae bacterium B102]|nr:hypothetical protein acdb102_19630 [Acidothermaceae bacterium B102]